VSHTYEAITGELRRRTIARSARQVLITGVLLALLLGAPSLRPCGAAAAETAPTGAREGAALRAAESDPAVAAVLEGKHASVAASSWGDAGGAPAGYSFVFRWDAADAANVDAAWPLLDSGQETPQPPYDSVVYRLRLEEVSSLRVDVLSAEARVLQILPLDGATDLVVREQTWPPFSWFGWLTANPWVLAPPFIAFAVVIMARAWRRSRAWNRHLPSMTRHDRQFIARLAVLVFLIAGFAWQFYEGWFAATGPSVGQGGSSAGNLTALPMLLIPPSLFVAGLVLELSSGIHRGSWGLLALLAAAASIFNLATALTGVTTNLNLTYYILLAVLALIAVPRAFSAGKTGWSRANVPHYG